MRVLLFLLLIPAILYGSTIGYLWVSMQSGADSLVQAASPFAEVQYSSVHVSPLGDEVGLNGIVIRPHMTQDEFRIEQVRFRVPHVGYFVDANKSMKEGRPPEHIGVQLRRMQFELDSEFLATAEQMQQQKQAMQRRQPAMQQKGEDLANALSAINAIGCGDIERFSLSDYESMGIDNIVADADFNISFNERFNTTRVDASINADRLYQMEMVFDFASKPAALKDYVLNNLPVSRINYRDTGYHQLRNDYCADLNGSTSEAYVDEHIQLMSKALGATFPDRATQAYREFMLKGGNLKLTMHPEESFSLNGIEYYRTGDIISALGLDLEINSTQLDTDAVQWDDMPKPTAGITSGANGTTGSTSAERSSSVKPAPSYHVVQVRDAGKYLRNIAEVTTREGKIRRGVLEHVDADRITLRIKMSAGSMSYPIEIYLIDKFRVYY